MRWEQAESLLAVAQSADLVRMRRGAIDDPCFYETLAFVPQCSEHQLDLAVSGAPMRREPIGSTRTTSAPCPGQPFDWWFPDLSDARADSAWTRREAGDVAGVSAHARRWLTARRS
ncbi:hypothetical protein BOX37_14260 [Nocardia mangyaensis]|uniref:Uncharacterized protein n=1 Tax=Nocardia mangyaensis TaxID=2213200 RepID=A0A1J0VSA3_9NOCA|nr:hypothetical protein [Nocardia mangyaensis]APE34917.1 hypothetical protein BOX37_14260 [Nocardia mangyaensis]